MAPLAAARLAAVLCALAPRVPDRLTVCDHAVAMSISEANRIGLDWRNGQRGYSATAGGTVPVYGVTLRSVRVGEVEVFNVDAVVLQAEMPAILLGNTFLNRFSMRRDADTMRLERK